MSTKRTELNAEKLSKVVGGAWEYSWGPKGGTFTSNEFSGSYTIPSKFNEAAQGFLYGEHPKMTDQQIADYLVQNFGATFNG